MKSSSKKNKQYTYPELIDRYFPGDSYLPDKQVETNETTETPDAFFDFLKRVSKPLPNQTDKAKRKLAQ